MNMVKPVTSVRTAKVSAKELLSERDVKGGGRRRRV
jgi:hypothetical protein